MLPTMRTSSQRFAHILFGRLVLKIDWAPRCRAKLQVQCEPKDHHQVHDDPISARIL
jgi:hypothetical protein